MWFALYAIDKTRLLGLHFTFSAYWIWLIVCYLCPVHLWKVDTECHIFIWMVCCLKSYRCETSHLILFTNTWIEWMAKVTVNFRGDKKKLCALKSRFFYSWSESRFIYIQAYIIFMSLTQCSWEILACLFQQCQIITAREADGDRIILCLSFVIWQFVLYI